MIDILEAYRGVFGITVIVFIAWAISENKKCVSFRMVASGIFMQFIVALLFLKIEPIASIFHTMARGINELFLRADAGIFFVFGERLGSASGPVGFVFAVRVLPLIVFFSALMAVLYHFGIMQKIILVIAWVLKKTLRVSGVESVVVAANVFVGQTEAPLSIRPYLSGFTRSQIATLMISGFATVAGTVLVAYVVFLGGDDPARRVFFLQHLLTASVISAPAAFVISKIIVPEIEAPRKVDNIELYSPVQKSWNVFDAAAHGAADGLRLSANIGAMLIAYISLLALVNWPFGAIGELMVGHQLTIQDVIGQILRPLVWAVGVPWSETLTVGSLIGEKLILTEFVAYQSLGDIIETQSTAIGQRSIVIAVYALCGFSNFASIAIQIGALTILAPEKRQTVVELSVKALVGGQSATLMTAAIAGLLI